MPEVTERVLMDNPAIYRWSNLKMETFLLKMNT